MTNVCLDYPDRTFFVNSNIEYNTLKLYSNDIQSRDRPWTIKYSSHLSEIDQSTFIPGTHVVAERFASNNWGHVIGDEVYATFNALHLWNITNPSDIMSVNILTDFLSESLDVYKILMDGKITPYTQDKTLKCYDRVIAGINTLGFVSTNRNILEPTSFRLRRLTRFVYKRLGIPLVQPAEGTGLSVVLVEKGNVCDHCHRFSSDALVQHLDTIFGSKLSIKRVSWDIMPVIEQVKLLSNADVMIAMSGSDVMNAIYMRHHTHLFILCRSRECDGNVFCGYEHERWFSHWGSDRARCFCAPKLFTTDRYLCTEGSTPSPSSMLNLTEDMFDRDFEQLISKRDRRKQRVHGVLESNQTL
eukprot:CAMPEP_0114461690 /NCGR_PEP_ID=MMETSP0104-20121206/6413_1 /TAXON_ID=37642 ORGANISM="Paraphysomonas imperforata, Strain PA2" /NCGR_SAMPLE_ID=MMETSP0104 /ASSEMBLY_ACC=CAM_ASM_000202 /LENGTH=357 /DNA_ID=CAMNT_0001634485 /DNA_START=198 /DNA_END=1271 /DNA_ORIENTATION=-